MKVAIIVVAFAIGLALFVIVGYEVYKDNFVSVTPISTITPSAAAAEAHPSLLYGRITLTDGTIYEGRLRWGRDQEAFWGDYFNGVKEENPWATHVAPERLRRESPLEIFGVEMTKHSDPIPLGRPFMARFGDIARIEMLGNDVRVTLKSGTTFNLDWYSVNDIADGVRVWDAKLGGLDVGSHWSKAIKTIDFFTAPRTGAVPHRLYGVLRTRQGNFTGFVAWNRNEGIGSDTLDGYTADGELRVRFDTIRSIARRSDYSSTVTLLDGREVVLSETDEAGKDNLGIYIDDERYGRVLISWDAFEHLDFSPAGTSPAYADYPPGRPLMGTVTTREGRRLTGRLVYDLDESETTETLDARSSQGVTYMIPFGLIASITLPRRDEQSDQRAKVMLQSGEEVLLERNGDLAENLGILIFVNGSPRPEHVLWADVQQINFERPPSMYPPWSRR